ncbi:acyl-CoA dehydrogenase family member 11-like isoform X2 [Sceloporus undulatus]|uniref:acyl-CoA dehydrogenase family member 11-like isoform X2 n=1 Tax=Sceloporus undulatus TaxID=8520 RepID=UPI001C4A8741|nr:acyl-CoA dehydrogenase family member 11-like isoform X2 [Sceloporus undulatus]
MHCRPFWRIKCRPTCLRTGPFVSAAAMLGVGFCAAEELLRALKCATSEEMPRISAPRETRGERVRMGFYSKSSLRLVFAEVNPDLERFGALVKDEIDPLGRECESQPPWLLQFDAWGRRVDEIVTCAAWKRMKEISAEEGLVAEAYERKHSNWSRIHQMAKVYLFTPASGFFSCPVAMTDGAAKVIESLGIPKYLEEAYARLTSRDAGRFWTSGQWMTERKGGSDVAGGTETVAQELPDGTYALRGFKWFTSAADSDVTLTLARIAAANGQVEEGTRGLSLFYVKLRDEEGNLNGIQIQRLKEKLGTRQLPTAELYLDGATAQRISKEGRGVAAIAAMLTVTRVHNAVTAVAGMRRAILLARDYAVKREAFGKCLAEHPLHMRTLARMEVEARGAFLLTMETARILGMQETQKATEEDRLMLRLLTPVVKLYTAKQAVAIASEALECFGGQGFMEDTGLAILLRDAQVLPIWEGTTNVLSLDVLRSLAKSRGKALDAFFAAAQAKMEPALGVTELEPSAQMVHEALRKLRNFAREMALKGEFTAQMAARDFAFTLARIYGGVLLLEHAAHCDATTVDAYAAQRWCRQDLCPIDAANEGGSYAMNAVSRDADLVFDGWPDPR